MVGFCAPLWRGLSACYELFVVVPRITPRIWPVQLTPELSTCNGVAISAGWGYAGWKASSPSVGASAEQLTHSEGEPRQLDLMRHARCQQLQEVEFI